MGAMALAARDGGAAHPRQRPDDIRAVKAAGLPVIGIHKVFGDHPSTSPPTSPPPKPSPAGAE